MGTQRGACGVSVAWFKIAAEKGNWDDDYIGEADRAWLRGEEDKAMLGWWIAAEIGYEAGQNNVAFALEKGIGKEIPWVRDAVWAGGAREWQWNAKNGRKGIKDAVQDGMEEHAGGLGLEMWTRSAAQNNVDAMVKVGDYYCMSSCGCLVESGDG
jgi:SEL1 protein